MKVGRHRHRQLVRHTATWAVLTTLVLLSGCWDTSETKASKRDKPPDLPAIAATNQPQVVTDLSKLSSAKTVVVPGGEATPTPTNSADKTKPATNEVLTHKIAAEAPKARYTEDVDPGYRGGTRLLNDKARQFANFSQLILDQTLKVAQQMAPDKLEGRRVPSDLQPVILTTVLDNKGRLNEIVIEQHSGDKLVDQWFIAACKKGVWSRNPPPAARMPDGNYRLRMQATVVNASFDRYGIYSYESEVGLSIL